MKVLRGERLVLAHMYSHRQCLPFPRNTPCQDSRPHLRPHSPVTPYPYLYSRSHSRPLYRGVEAPVLTKR